MEEALRSGHSSKVPQSLREPVGKSRPLVGAGPAPAWEDGGGGCPPRLAGWTMRPMVPQAQRGSGLRGQQRTQEGPGISLNASALTMEPSSFGRGRGLWDWFWSEGLPGSPRVPCRDLCSTDSPRPAPMPPLERAPTRSRCRERDGHQGAPWRSRGRRRARIPSRRYTQHRQRHRPRSHNPKTMN